MDFCLEKLITADISALNTALDICADNGDFATIFCSNPIEGENDEFGFWDSSFGVEVVNGRALIVVEGASQCQGFGFYIKGYFNGKGENVGVVFTDRNNKWGKHTRRDKVLYRMIKLRSIELDIEGENDADNFRDNVGDIFLNDF